MTNSNDEKSTVDLGERNDSGLVEVSKGSSTSQKMLLVGAFVIVAIMLVAQGFKIFSSKSSEEEVTKNEIDVVGKNNFSSGKEAPKEFDNTKFDFGSDPEPTPQEPPVLIGTTTTVVEVEPIKPNLNRSAAGFMVKVGSGKKVDYIQPTVTEGNGNPDDLLGNGGDADIFTAPAFKPSVAKKSIYNPHLLLSQGTVIPCSLRGRLVTNVGGQISCIVTDNVLSSSGAVVLIERGSVINGFYQGNTVQKGHNEIFVVWQEARTPNNLIIPLYSGSTDPLGANGLSGWVDNHFWERFGNAMVLSVFNDVTGALAQNLTKDSKQDYTQNTREDTRNLTAEIIKRTADIEPTLYKNQGDKVNVFIARDIDFSNVYSLKQGYRK